MSISRTSVWWSVGDRSKMLRSCMLLGPRFTTWRDMASHQFHSWKISGCLFCQNEIFRIKFHYLLNDKILGNSRWIIRKGWKTNQYGENLLFVNGNFAVCASCQPNVACYGTEEEQHKLIIVPPSLVQVLCTSGHWQITTSCCSFGNNLQIIW